MKERKSSPIILALSIGVLAFFVSHFLLTKGILGPENAVFVSLLPGIVGGSLTWLISRNRILKSEFTFHSKETSALFKEIPRLVSEIRKFLSYIEDEETANVVRNICDDSKIYLQKLAEKTPDTCLTSLTIHHGKLTAMLEDILPQYIEYQNGPRWEVNYLKYCTAALGSFKAFHLQLLQEIASLELDDNMRFRVAVTLLGLKSKTIRGQINELQRIHKEK